MTAPILQTDALSVRFSDGGGLFSKPRIVQAVSDISITLSAGETLALVGESGSGKTTFARAMLGLTPISAGTVHYDGRNCADMTRQDRQTMRRAVQMVFQDPFGSLDPRLSIEAIIAEPLRIHRIGTARSRSDRVVDLLARVGLPADARRRYPHQFSGGQRQRIGIARALAVEPRFLICDEPVSSLDVSIRGQILNLLATLQDTLGLAYLYISHDLSSVRFISHRVAVMYLGRIVEVAEVNTLFAHPLHHYTNALLLAIPVPDPDAISGHSALAGEVPSPSDIPSGCRFHPRCPAALAICRSVDPVLTDAGEGHQVACHNPR